MLRSLPRQASQVLVVSSDHYAQEFPSVTELALVVSNESGSVDEELTRQLGTAVSVYGTPKVLSEEDLRSTFHEIASKFQLKPVEVAPISHSQAHQRNIKDLEDLVSRLEQAMESSN
jgi:hypothetical protein